LLTAQTVAWLQKRQLPLPGAVGLFCAGGLFFSAGDSGHFGAALSGAPFPGLAEYPYLKDADPNDPLVFPAQSAHVMELFPPSLLITGTRDYALSSVVYTHSVLVRLGVDADLHVWEGLGHAFFFDPDLPQSKEMYRVVVNFFDRHLGAN
jgi:monoterpene epsilon-lactone hydrolase